MKKQEQQQDGQEMFQYNQNNPNIGTQILDNALPSSINFDEINNKKINNNNVLEGQQIQKSAKYTQKGKQPFAADIIKVYTIKGKVEPQNQVKYPQGSIVKDGSIQAYQVKALDQEKSSGMKFIWETLVGYTKRQIFAEEGYFYLLQRVKQGYLVHKTFKLKQLFKIFSDPDENQVRLVFRSDNDGKLITKNFQVKQCSTIVEMISDQAGKAGLMTVASE